MPGDVGLVAKLLSEIFGFVVSEDGYERMSREYKLRWLGRGIQDAIDSNNMALYDQLMAEYRRMRQES